MVIRWVKALARWIAKKFKKSKSRGSPRVIKRYYGSECAILRIERLTRGAIATYRVIPRVGDWDYLLTLDSLALIEAEMVGRISGADFILRSHGGQPVSSHRFAVWRVHRSGVVVCTGCWDCNLEGVYSQGILTPIRVFSHTVLSVLKIRPTKVLSWQQQMEIMDWMNILEGYARGYLGADHQIMAMRRI